MGHFGILETSEHSGRILNGLEDVRVKRFPITTVQMHAASQRGEGVYDVSIGQVVVMPNGTGYAHGTQDGLHERGDEIFS